MTEIDFVPGPFRCQIEQQYLDFAVVFWSTVIAQRFGFANMKSIGLMHI